jgi:hypothetical protein
LGHALLPEGTACYLILIRPAAGRPKRYRCPDPKAARDMSSSEDITTMDDPDLIAERRRVREALEHTPPCEISPELRQRFRRLDDEFVRRAQATWSGSQ